MPDCMALAMCVTVEKDRLEAQEASERAARQAEDDKLEAEAAARRDTQETSEDSHPAPTETEQEHVSACV